MTRAKSHQPDRPKQTAPEQPKPELTAQEAAYLVNKLDQPIQTDGHQDRNNLNIVVGKLVQIAKWQEADSEQDTDAV